LRGNEEYVAEEHMEVAMRTLKLVSLGLIVVFGIGCLIYAADPSTKREKRLPVTISAEDLCNGKCVIIGRLGKPYGEIVKMRGVWDGTDGSKAEYPLFRVTHVDGKKVADNHPIVINQMFVERLRDRPDLRQDKTNATGGRPRQGDVYEGRAYESGGYIREPRKINEIFHKPGAQDPYGFAFYSFLYLID
jgi:hypothetical protein